ncbi:Uncharacterized protein DAT39_007642 [Clarias magur]|uniref:Uncharacterized protein n=1 Tax=Clarias magur TaxID=1594786 RepID=A0A8J4UNM7_CLAMG|nr:Uncharacterized protein DAT39_007642 [Clarias magur]
MLEFLLPVSAIGTARQASSAKAESPERPVNARDGLHGHRRRARAWGRGLSTSFKRPMADQ